MFVLGRNYITPQVDSEARGHSLSFLPRDGCVAASTPRATSSKFFEAQRHTHGAPVDPGSSLKCLLRLRPKTWSVHRPQNLCNPSLLVRLGWDRRPKKGDTQHNGSTTLPLGKAPRWQNNLLAGTQRLQIHLRIEICDLVQRDISLLDDILNGLACPDGIRASSTLSDSCACRPSTSHSPCQAQGKRQGKEKHEENPPYHQQSRA